MKSTSCNPTTFSTLFGAALNGTISEEDRAVFTSHLATDEAARKLWFEFCDVECGLKELNARQNPSLKVSPLTRRKTVSLHTVSSTTVHGKPWPGLAWAAAAVFVFAVSEYRFFNRGPECLETANFGSVNDALWAYPENIFNPGDPVRAGQTLELLSGSADLKFNSGAEVTLYGPAIFQATSANGGFLKFGKLSARATSKSAKGFTVQTPTSRVVDMGTEFIASASADGQSQVEVTSGEVYVHIPWRDEAMRLLGGQALSTESDLQRVNVRMESGDGSDAFRLPSIESPLDFEKGSSVRGFSSGRLIGAQAPAAAVDVKQEADGRIVFDLGRSVSVTKINAYSWARTRIFDFDMKGAAQNFELYGSNTHRIPAANDPVDKDGWELIGRVDADSYFSQIGSPVKVGQQACSFTSATGCLGTYRYLMCVPLRRASEPILAASKTCLGLLDVYSEPWTF